MKTVMQVSKEPRGTQMNCKSLIWQVYPTKFHHFCAKYAKKHEHHESKTYDQQILKTVRKVPERTHEGPKTVVQSSGEKYFSTKIHHFRAKYFSSFRNFPPLVLDFFSTSRSICYVVPNLFCMIFPGKIIRAKINYSVPRICQKTSEKLRLTPKFWRSKLACPRIRITL